MVDTASLSQTQQLDVAALCVTSDTNLFVVLIEGRT